MCALDVRPPVGAPIGGTPITGAPCIGTERLILRAPVAADAPAIAELAGDIRVAGMVARLPHPYQVSDAESWLAGLAQRNPRTDAVFALEHRQFGLIGVLGFHEKPAAGEGGLGGSELGYWLGHPFWNRGYATEAVTAALAWARGEWRKNVVWAGHFADNRASGQVLVKAGFLYTGDVEATPCLARGGQPVPSRKMVWLA